MYKKLFFNEDVTAIKNDKTYTFTIEMKSLFNNKPDCKIGDFYNNFWFRTNKALSKGWTGYKDESTLKKAVKLSLLKHGFNNIRFIEQQRLVIGYDESSESPREWGNLGYFITIDRNYNSPDDNNDFMEIIKETGDEANSQAEHMKMIKKEIRSRLDEEVLAIYPVVKYEHGGVVYKLGTIHGFDYSNNGFYIVTDKTVKEYGTDNTNKNTAKQAKVFERIIKGELDIYNHYINGEVYGFTLYDEQGEVSDSCWGFYDIEDIREHLPKEWKDEDLTDYIND